MFAEILWRMNKLEDDNCAAAVENLCLRSGILSIAIYDLFLGEHILVSAQESYGNYIERLGMAIDAAGQYRGEERRGETAAR